MLPIKFVRENPEIVQEGVHHKNETADIHKILELDSLVRNKIQKVEELKAYRNRVNREISTLTKDKENAGDLIQKMKTISTEIKVLDGELNELKGKLHQKLLWVPNLPHISVPVGTDADNNTIDHYWGEMPEFDFSPKNHTDLGKNLNLFDFERGSKISGTGFPLYTGVGAKLERALINFMLDRHTANGYVELYTPFLTLRRALESTGQLPKLEDDMYYLDNEDMFLIPTAEVPVTNTHLDEILTVESLPIRYVAFSPCFRREAGSYGRETRGLLRVHQFNKVEMVKFVEPDSSYDELETLLHDAESIIQTLGLHYRVVTLCSGDLSFAAAKCYDIELWAPGEKRWLEVSSCSNYESFQARRANIRYRNKEGKLDFVHTLNGSGVATARLMVALLETYQQEDGTIELPEVLHPYTGFPKISVN